MYDFLSNYKKRMLFITPISKIAEVLGNRLRYKEYDMLNITYATLCYLQDKTLSEDRGCDINEIGDYIYDLINTFYDEVMITKLEASEMGRYIIEEVIENEVVLNATIKDLYRRDGTESRAMKIVEADTEVGALNRYKLSHLGIEILFRTDEVDKEMRITMQTLILKEAIRSGNYDKAVYNIKDLLNTARQLRIEIEDLISNIKLRVETITLSTIRDIQDKLNVGLKNQYDKFYEIMDLICDKKRNICIEFAGKSDDEIEGISLKIDFIKSKLDLIIFEYLSMLNKKQTIFKTYNDELDNAMSVGYANSYDFSDIKREIEKHPVTGDKILALFRPMLNFKFKKHFNPNKLFSPQQIIGDREQEQGIDESNSLKVDVGARNKWTERIVQANETYVFLLECLIRRLSKSPGEWVRMSDFLSLLKSEEEAIYERFVCRPMFNMVMSIYTNQGRSLLIRKNIVENTIRKLPPDDEFYETFVLSKLSELNNDALKYEKLEIKSNEEGTLTQKGKFIFSNLEMRVI